MTEFKIIWPGSGKVHASFHFEVFEGDAKRLALRLLHEFDQRNIPFEGRHGLVWDGCELEHQKWWGVLWTPHPKLILNSMCLYHEDAIYPPAIVLRPEAIIYGKIDANVR